MYYLSTMVENIAPVICVICVMVVCVVFIAYRAKIKTAEALSVDRAYVEQLLQEILQENTDIKAELADIQEKVSSIEKMMKDV